jgi:seryl-tRNA synthetase
MAAIQELKSAIKRKQEIQQRYLKDLRGFNKQAQDKQSELDQIEADLSSLNAAVAILESAEVEV